jgi:hypothetical protein
MLTVIRHFLLHILTPEHTVIIPPTIAIFTTLSVVEIQDEIRHVLAKDMEMPEEEGHRASHQTYFRVSV